MILIANLVINLNLIWIIILLIIMLNLSFLKELIFNIYDNVADLLGTIKGAEKLEKGAGGDISMQIDVSAEKAVIDFLNDKKVDILLISEEIGEVYIGDKEKAIKSRERLILDPIDGSNNAVRGIPFCCISVAYAIGEKLSDVNIGLVLDLSSKDLYWAEKGKGAFMNKKKIHVSDRTIEDNIIAEIDYDLDSLDLEFIKYKRILDKIYRIRTMGSNALSLCMVAKGALDAFIDFRPYNRIIDIAAGSLIIKEAGGEIFSKSGENLNVELKLNEKIPLIASNAKIAAFLKKELKKIF
ncbi:MAG: inositol monophosphatase family protein [Promethearchaeia archaeon]